MAKDLIKEGMTFALGLAKISGQRFNKVIKGLEKKNKVSSNEGEKMVYRWISEQQKQLEKMRRQIKKESIRTRIYSAKDLVALNKVVKKLSKEIAGLEKKKKKTEKAARKSKKKAMRKRTAKKKTGRKPAKKKRKR